MYDLIVFIIIYSPDTDISYFAGTIIMISVWIVITLTILFFLKWCYRKKPIESVEKTTRDD